MSSNNGSEQTIRAPAIYTSTPLSFWGGIDPITGRVIDKTHPLHNASTSQKIFCLPSGRGSCTGSQVMLELVLNGVAPKALILREIDVILCVGVIIAEEFFDVTNFPLICVVGKEQYEELLIAQDDQLTLRVSDSEEVEIQNKFRTFTAQNLLRLPDRLESDLVLDDTKQSQAKILAMKTIRRVASITSTTELIPILSAHIDAVTYIGPGGLRFVQKLVELGAKVAVPTTLNAQSVDRRRWEQLGVDKTYAANANAVGDAYLEMGCDGMSFTCAPYLLPRIPKRGDDIIWGESNAVVYANSVLGARTEKYADYFDTLGAIAGVVPRAGVHIQENRLPDIIIDAKELIQEDVIPAIEQGHDVESFYPAMGWLCGKLSDGQIPLITGFESLPSVTSDNLKAFCAAFGTTGTSPVFHMAHVTPEAMQDTIDNLLISCNRRVLATKQDLCLAYQTLDGGSDESDNRVHLVALGNPHLSVTELRHISEIIRSDVRPKHQDVEVIATLGRHVYEEGRKLNYIQDMETFGVRFVNDTCWCMLLHPPIIPHSKDASILTNSSKYATYGPGLVNRTLRFSSIYGCIEASKTGTISQHCGVPKWLRSFSTMVRHFPK